MAVERIRHELKSLNSTCVQLTQRVQEISEGARYRRAGERALQFYDELRKARGYVEMAMAALERRESVKVEPVVEPPSEPGWLRGKIAHLTNHLMGAVAAEDDPVTVRPPEPSTEVHERAGFHGDSWAIPIPALLGFLQVQTKTGVLAVQLEGEVISIEFENGELVHAFSDNSPAELRLGAMLVEQGTLDEKRLDSFLFCHSSSQGRIGEALRRGELVTEQELRAALDHQVQQLFHRLFSAEGAEYSFVEGLPEGESSDRARLNVTQLLLESARVIDESGAPPADAAPSVAIDDVGQDAEEPVP